MRIHTGDKPYQCNQCDKAFLANSNLVRHMRPQNREKPYQWKIILKYILEHTGMKPYQCNQGDKAFVTNSNHIRHMRSHKRDKSYQCRHYGKFISENNIITR